MTELIIRSLQGLATQGELEELAVWRSAAPENEEAYQDIVFVWRATEDGGLELNSQGSPPASAAIIAGAGGQVGSPAIVPAKYAAERKLSGRAQGWLAAALIAVIVLAAASIWRNALRGPDRTFAATEVLTGPGEMVTTRLSDGTTVRLAPRSRLLLGTGPDSREVWLDGHAFFAVAHDPARPFTVRTRVGDAVVLGTRFDIRVEDQEVQVAVVEGRVALAAQGERVEVAAGELIRAGEGSAPRVEMVADLGPILAWMDGFLAFQDTPLSTAALEIEARFGVRVLIADSALGQRTVSALFTTEDANQVLAVLCRAAAAHCTATDSTFSIEP